VIEWEPRTVLLLIAWAGFVMLVCMAILENRRE